MTATKTTATRRSAEFLEFVDAYKNVAELSASLKAAERELASIQELMQASWPEGTDEVKTARGIITRAEKTSYSVTASDSELVEFARMHGLKTTSPKPESVASATLRAAAGRGIDVSAVCSVETSPVFSVN